MTSTQQIGHIGTFALAIGAGLLIAGGAVGVASASTEDSGATPMGSVSVSSAASSVRTGRASATKVLAGPTRPSRLGAATATSGAASGNSRQAVLVTPSITAMKVRPVMSKVATVQTSITEVVSPAITAPSPTDQIYGKLSNSQYWEHQGPWNTCVLMSTAMVIGQLTGTMPTGDEIVAEAERTKSVYPNFKPYEVEIKGSNGKPITVQRTRNGMVYQEVNDEYVKYADSLQILFNHKIKASATYYTDAQSARALSDLENALRGGASVIVTINSAIRNDIIFTPGSYTGGTVTANHAVTVLAINVTKREVYINDTALTAPVGNYLTLSYDAFVKAWKPGRYTLITATLADPANPPTAPAQWKLVA